MQDSIGGDQANVSAPEEPTTYERIPAKAEWVVFHRPQQKGMPMRSLVVDGRTVLTEVDQSGRGAVNHLIINLDGLPFITVTDTNYTGKFDTIEYVSRSGSNEPPNVQRELDRLFNK